MALNFEKYAQEGNEFLNKLAKGLGHPEEDGRTGIILRAVMHTLRERITISESLNLLAQLPMFLKGIYVDGWNYKEKPLDLKSVEDFTNEVKKYQAQYGERQFNWEDPTEEIVKTVLHHLGKYISDGQFEDIIAQMPKPLKKMISESRNI